MRYYGLCLVVTALAIHGSPAIPHKIQSEKNAQYHCSTQLLARASDLSLKPDEFMHAKEHGWRYFVNLGCYMQAAVLIDIYLKTHPGLNDDFKPVMSFYGGQMFALSGNSETAVEFLRAAYREGSGEGNTAWNLFIDGLIAFHERDKNKLRASRDLLINAKSAHQEFDPSLLDRLLDGFNEPFLKTYLELARMEDPAGQTGHKR